MTALPQEARARKAVPVATGCVDYFPDALAAVAELSRIGNDQHNPGKPLHWDRSKSTDDADALMRHFLDRGGVDADGVRHSVKVAWRALALLQRELEAEGKPATSESPVVMAEVEFGPRASLAERLAALREQERAIGERPGDTEGHPYEFITSADAQVFDAGTGDLIAEKRYGFWMGETVNLCGVEELSGTVVGFDDRSVSVLVRWNYWRSTSPGIPFPPAMLRHGP